MTTAIGVDIGGSGIKGAVVDLGRGDFAGERIRIETPQPAVPDAMAEVVARIVSELGDPGPVGCTLPSVVRSGTVHSAANIDPSWIGTDAEALMEAAVGRPVAVLNDADAAGVAEQRFGAAADRTGVVIVLTLGTGIGSALLLDGRLVPNTEFGHLELDGHEAEHRAAAQVRKAEELSWSEWGARLDRYLHHVEDLFSPDLFVLGGGVSRKHDKFLSELTVETEVVPAALRNRAGIVGAAAVAAERRPTD
jgi:polyphosphate glucokinase